MGWVRYSYKFSLIQQFFLRRLFRTPHLVPQNTFYQVLPVLPYHPPFCFPPSIALILRFLVFFYFFFTNLKIRAISNAISFCPKKGASSHAFAKNSMSFVALYCFHISTINFSLSTFSIFQPFKKIAQLIRALVGKLSNRQDIL